MFSRFFILILSFYLVNMSSFAEGLSEQKIINKISFAVMNDDFLEVKHLVQKHVGININLASKSSSRFEVPPLLHSMLELTDNRSKDEDCAKQKMIIKELLRYGASVNASGKITDIDVRMGGDDYSTRKVNFFDLLKPEGYFTNLNPKKVNTILNFVKLSNANLMRSSSATILINFSNQLQVMNQAGVPLFKSLLSIGTTAESRLQVLVKLMNDNSNGKHDEVIEALLNYPLPREESLRLVSYAAFKKNEALLQKTLKFVDKTDLSLVLETLLKNKINEKTFRILDIIAAQSPVSTYINNYNKTTYDVETEACPTICVQFSNTTEMTLLGQFVISRVQNMNLNSVVEDFSHLFSRLRELGADFQLLQKWQGRTESLLTLAVGNGTISSKAGSTLVLPPKPSVVEALVSAGVDVNVTDSQGISPLTWSRFLQFIYRSGLQCQSEGCFMITKDYQRQVIALMSFNSENHGTIEYLPSGAHFWVKKAYEYKLPLISIKKSQGSSTTKWVKFN